LYPYWLLFLYFALGALWTANTRETGRVPARVFFLIGLLGAAMLIGLRYKVGGDWGSYLGYFKMMRFDTFATAISRGDPGYQAVNYAVYNVGGEIWLVNLVCGAVLCWGLGRFALTQRNPWLVVLVAVPYLINVVAMGYTRQSVAIGLILAGLAALIRGKGLVTFTVYVLIAGLFHRTAVSVLPLVLLVSTRYRLVNIVAVAVFSFLLFNYLLSNQLGTYVTSYLVTRYASQGAAVRVAMTVFAGVLFLFANKRFGFEQRQWRIWLNFSLASIAALVLLLVSPSSTAVDRMALYLFPLQLAIMPQVPYVYARKGLGTIAVGLYAAAIQFVWLNYAVYASWFVPYRFYPF
jgi:hypothetical protein